MASSSTEGNTYSRSRNLCKSNVPGRSKACSGPHDCHYCEGAHYSIATPECMSEQPCVLMSHQTDRCKSVCSRSLGKSLLLVSGAAVAFALSSAALASCYQTILRGIELVHILALESSWTPTGMCPEDMLTRWS